MNKYFANLSDKVFDSLLSDTQLFVLIVYELVERC